MADGVMAASLFAGDWIGAFTAAIAEKQLGLAGKVPWGLNRMLTGIGLGFLFSKVKLLRPLSKPTTIMGFLSGFNYFSPAAVAPLNVASKTGLGDYAVARTGLGYGPTAADYGMLGAPSEFLGDYFQATDYTGLPTYQS